MKSLNRLDKSKGKKYIKYDIPRDTNRRLSILIDPGLNEKFADATKYSGTTKRHVITEFVTKYIEDFQKKYVKEFDNKTGAA